MFHGFGRNVCDVQFFEVVKRPKRKAKRKKIDRFEVLDRQKSWSTSKSLVRMNNRKDVLKVADRLCRAKGPDADIRAKARCGSRGEWVPKVNPKEKLCMRKEKRKKNSSGELK